MTDTFVMEENQHELHSAMVPVRVNSSGTIRGVWANFDSPQPGDGKLRQFLNRSSYPGAYMTDLVKGYIESDSNDVDNLAPEVVEKNVRRFRDEMKLLGETESTLFVLFGRKARSCFSRTCRFSIATR